MSTATLERPGPAQPSPTPPGPGGTAASAARRHRLTAAGLNLLAPLLAIAVAVAISSIILLLSGKDVMPVWQALLDWPLPRKQVNILNEAMPLYLAGVAVAIGFRMNLFNIGVEGQYRLAAFVAALVAGQAWLSGWPNIIVATFAAMAAGALWAGIAAWLKVTRGVNEVISTIMLNAISTGLVAYLLNKVNVLKGSANVSTEPIKPNSQVAGLHLVPDAKNLVYGYLPLVLLVGVAYWFMLSRTRFGFDLRASGLSETAARASGVSARRMIVMAMLLSGAVAGLVGMPELFGRSYAFTLDTQAGIGFSGIAVALLGRNHPLGIGVAALLWSFLEQQKVNLDKVGVSNDMVLILQGIIVLSVVVAYELVRRLTARLEQSRVAQALGGTVEGGLGPSQPGATTSAAPGPAEVVTRHTTAADDPADPVDPGDRTTRHTTLDDSPADPATRPTPTSEGSDA